MTSKTQPYLLRILFAQQRMRVIISIQKLYPYSVEAEFHDLSLKVSLIYDTIFSEAT